VGKAAWGKGVWLGSGEGVRAGGAVTLAVAAEVGLAWTTVSAAAGAAQPATTRVIKAKKKRAGFRIPVQTVDYTIGRCFTNLRIYAILPFPGQGAGTRGLGSGASLRDRLEVRAVHFI
jgi:hypothetical protein